MNEKQAEALANIFGGEAWQSGGDIWLVSYWRGDGKYIVFSGDAVCEYDSEEDFDAAKASNTLILASGDEEWFVVVDSKGNVFYRDQDLEVGWRTMVEADYEARGLQSRTGENYSVKELDDA